MLIIGCDYHPGFQQIAFVDTESGEADERRLTHREEALIALGQASALSMSEMAIFRQSYGRRDSGATINLSAYWTTVAPSSVDIGDVPRSSGSSVAGRRPFHETANALAEARFEGSEGNVLWLVVVLPPSSDNIHQILALPIVQWTSYRPDPVSRKKERDMGGDTSDGANQFCCARTTWGNGSPAASLVRVSSV